MSRIKVLLGIVFLASATVATARPIYVGCGAAASDRTALADNSATHPFATPKMADQVAQPGDVVYFVGACTFGSFGIAKSGTPAAWITWRSAPGAAPVILIDTDAYAAISVYASYIRISGLTLKGRNDELTLAAAEANDVLLNPALPWNAQTNPKRDPELAIFNGNGIRTIDSRGTTGAYTHHVRIDNNTIGNFGCAGISLMGDYFHVEFNRIFNNAWYSGYGCSGLSFFTTRTADNAPGYHNEILNNYVWNNVALVKTFKRGVYSDGNGLLLDIDQTVGGYKGRTLIANNLVVNNGGGGIAAFTVPHVDILNNTAYKNNTFLGGADIAATYSDDVRVMNNITYGIRGAGHYVTKFNKDTPSVIYDHNLYFDGSADAPALGQYDDIRNFPAPVYGKVPVKGANDIVGQDPLFEYPVLDLSDPRLNFRLRPGSPAIDSGIVIDGATPSFDARYAPRPQGGRADIGAFEFTNQGTYAVQELPVLAAPAYIKTKLGASVDLAIAAQNGPVTFSMVGAPPGVTINSAGVIGGTVAASTAGSFAATVSAANTVGTSKVTVIFSVDPQ